MIIKDIQVYDGPLIHKRFAYDYFRNKVLPTGNIIAFRCPMDVSIDGMIDQEDVLQGDYIYSDDAVNFCWEIPNLDKFGAVAFQRLLNTQIASILAGLTNKPIEVDGDDLMRITYSKDNVAIGHTGININAGSKAPAFAYSTKLDEEQTQEFMTRVIDTFYGMVDDIFIATTKINL